MRAQDFLTEGATDILYHYTGASGAVDILRSGEFGFTVLSGADRKSMPPGYDFYLSTTRSRVGDYHRTSGNIGVMFVLDGRAIGQRYRVVPVDYWEQSWLSTHRPGMGGVRTSESEDRILSTRPSMPLSYAREIHIFVRDRKSHEKTPAWVRTLIDLAEQRGIPHWTYFNESAWRLQDRRRALSPEHEQEYFQGDLESRRDYAGTQWEPMNYLARWEQLIDLDPSQRAELRPKAQDLVRQLEYGVRPGDDAGLIQDLSNTRKPYDVGRSSAVKILQFMRRNRLDAPGLVQYLAKKWERRR